MSRDCRGAAGSTDYNCPATVAALTARANRAF